MIFLFGRLSRGTVQACGTADFLKRRFGCGYVLTIATGTFFCPSDSPTGSVVHGLGGSVSYRLRGVVFAHTGVRKAQ